jgi:CHASE2 domain-containing sensor protein
VLGALIKLRHALRWRAGVRFALAWHAMSMLIAFGVACLLLLLEPFDLDRGIAERGRDAFYKIAAFGYPERRSPKTLVVQLDEQFLRQAGQAWPVPYGVHAGTLQLLAARRPRAIFVDFLFVDARPDPELDLLITTIERVSEHTPIYLAAAPSAVIGRPARPEIQSLVERAPGVHFVSIVHGRDMGAGYAYRIAPDADGLAPAAVRLYHDLCSVPRACTVDSAESEMDVWWAAPRRDSFNCRGEVVAACERLPGGVITRTLSLLSGVFSGVLPPSWRPVDPVPVAYAPTIGLSDLLNASVQEQVRERIEGATIFYGSSLAFTGDVDDSPVHGQINGISTHAMAYDNLHALGGHFITDRAPFGWGFKGHLVFLSALLAALCLAGRGYATLRWPQRRLRPHRKHRFFGAIDAGVLMAGAVVIAIIEFNFAHVGPTAWAPVLVAAAAGDLLSARPLSAASLIWLMRRARTARTGASAGRALLASKASDATVDPG